ncbi:MAG: hypothetical protein CMM49_03200 [Rhodospirillaceae bacterium]|nr:hypothetical protein [Rhodospirillaceae bacterium]|tara:strand:+ start:778 stop:1629 length:852 start_codon:yes stop_codon:yes gene_type:complete
MRILLTGATGITGKHILNSLIKTKNEIITFSRNSVKQNIKNLEHRTGDLYSLNDIDLLLKDIDVVYHIPPNMHKDEVKLSSNLLRYICKYKIKHFVYHSVLHPNIKNLPHHWNKMIVEDLIIKSKINYTIIQPSSYMQNIFNDKNNITNKNTHLLPFSLNSKLCIVDLNDISEVASLVIGNKKHFFSKYELAGPEMLSGNDKAKILSKVLGKKIIARRESINELEEKLLIMNVNIDEIKTRLKMFEYYSTYGLPGNSNILKSLLQRKPKSFEQFIFDNKNKFQ